MAWVMAKRAPRRHPAAGDSPAGAALAAPSAEPGGATVAVIAARIEGSRPGIADTWTPAAPPRRWVGVPQRVRAGQRGMARAERAGCKAFAFVYLIRIVVVILEKVSI